MRSWVAALVLSVAAWGQTYGELSGTITDPAGTPVPNVRIKLINTANGRSRDVQTTEAGVYSAPFLSPGRYDLAAEATGFKLSRRRGVEVQVDTKVRVDLRLEIGTVTETVEVTAATPLINSENAAVGTVIENRRIIELPLNGRGSLDVQ